MDLKSRRRQWMRRMDTPVLLKNLTLVFQLHLLLQMFLLHPTSHLHKCFLQFKMTWALLTYKPWLQSVKKTWRSWKRTWVSKRRKKNQGTSQSIFGNQVVAELLHKSWDDIMLLMGHEQMKLQKQLHTYGVRDGSTIDIILRLRGGDDNTMVDAKVFNIVLPLPIDKVGVSCEEEVDEHYKPLGVLDYIYGCEIDKDDVITDAMALYASSFCDMFDNPKTIGVKEFRGRGLFSVEIDKYDKISAKNVKKEIANRFLYITEDDFLLNGLGDNDRVCDDVELLLRLRGGAKGAKVIKTVLKGNVRDLSCVGAWDRSTFESIINQSQKLTTLKMEDVKAVFASLSIETLQEMEAYLTKKGHNECQGTWGHFFHPCHQGYGRDNEQGWCNNREGKGHHPWILQEWVCWRGRRSPRCSFVVIIYSIYPPWPAGWWPLRICCEKTHWLCGAKFGTFTLKKLKCFNQARAVNTVAWSYIPFYYINIP